MKKLALATIIISIGMSLAGCNNSTTVNNGNEANKQVTIDQAKEIALNHANLTSDQVSFIRAESDLDNGVKKYDIEFYHGNKEYDYEVDASNGAIIKYDYDIEYNNQNSNQDNNNQSINQGINQNNLNNEGSISEEQAKEIALKHAGLANDQVSLKRVELDFDNGVQVYEVEFYYNNVEYSYEINANTGDILKYEQD